MNTLDCDLAYSTERHRANLALNMSLISADRICLGELHQRD
jgi:hypothetical protein